MGIFDSKDFNSKAFTYKVGHVPNLVRNELIIGLPTEAKNTIKPNVKSGK